MSNNRKDLLKRLDDLNEVCDNCITITYNVQMYGVRDANVYCITDCPLAKHFYEVGIKLQKETCDKRENENGEGKIRGT